MITFFGYLFLGIAAIIISAIAMREKTQGLIIAGWIIVGIMGLIIIAHLRYVKYLFIDLNFLYLLVLGAVFIIPVIFLINAGGNKSKSGDTDYHAPIDGSGGGGEVTEEYLDEIINSPDEDIDFEEDLDLR